MSKINFFQKAKLAIKFRRAGEGHSLNESSSSSASNQPQAQQGPRKAPSSDAQKAGKAAIARFSKQDTPGRRPQSATATWKSHSSEPSASSETDKLNFARLRLEVKTDLERESVASNSGQVRTSEQEVIRQEAAPVLAVSGVYFKCPFCNRSYGRREVRNHMEECLVNSLESDQTLTPVNMIKSLNKDQIKVQSCIDVLCKYLDNILQNPDEEKYRRIRQGNKVFQERVRRIKGAVEFLISCGFVETPLPDNVEELCFNLEEVDSDVIDKLTVMKEILLATDPCKPVLDRSLKILHPSSCNGETLELPNDFYEFNSDEVKRMQTERTQEIERNAQLRTRATREKEDKNPSRIYRFTLLRVKFPDGVILQGTFNAREKASSLMTFVREQLQTDWLPFMLSEPGGHQLTQEDVTFVELDLVPAAILHFNWDASVMADIQSAGTTPIQSNYLKPELLERL